MIFIDEKTKHEWKVGDPMPPVSGRCTKFYADGAELIEILALMSRMSAPAEGRNYPPEPAPFNPQEDSFRPMEDIHREMEALAPLCRQEFAEHELARTIMTVLSWVVNRGAGRPLAEFGWITTSIQQIAAALNGKPLNEHSVMQVIEDLGA